MPILTAINVFCLAKRNSSKFHHARRIPMVRLLISTSGVYQFIWWREWKRRPGNILYLPGLSIYWKQCVIPSFGSTYQMPIMSLPTCFWEKLLIIV